MVESAIKATGGRGQRPLNLLLLAGDDEVWTNAVQRAAHSMVAAVVHRTHSVNEAMSRLVVGDPDFSHLLVKSDFVGDRIGDLANLTAGESHSRTILVMLGNQGIIPPRSAVVHDADLGSLTRAIVSGATEPPAAVAPLKLAELEAALTGTQLLTRYQPIVRFADSQPVGLEVLARLDHPFHGTLSPEHFVSQMELAGLSRRLTEGVIERAFADHAQHLAVLGLWLALNFPLDVLMDEPALLTLEQSRMKTGIAAEQIVIELTESRPVNRLDAAGLAVLQRSLSRLRALGYGVAIDDLGPTMINHRALFDLDVTSVKLDKDLVAATAREPQALGFVADAIATAHKIGVSVVAEGIKDEVTWQRMQKAGADYAQGYYIARPLPAAAVPVWLTAWQNRVASGN